MSGRDTEKVLKSQSLPGTMEVRNEDGGFHRRFGGANAHIVVWGSGSRCHDAGFSMSPKE